MTAPASDFVHRPIVQLPRRQLALHREQQCWCGNSKSDINKHGRSDKCDMACPGNTPREEICGGHNAISIYEMEGTPKDVPDDAKYLGCFADSSRDRALTLTSTSNDKDMSYAVRSTTLCASCIFLLWRTN